MMLVASIAKDWELSELVIRQILLLDCQANIIPKKKLELK